MEQELTKQKQSKEKAKGKLFWIILIGVLAIGYLVLMYEVARHQHYTYATFQVKNQPVVYSNAQLESGEAYELTVQVHNRSNVYMNTALGGGYYMTYHLYDENKELLSYENRRTDLVHGIFAGDHTKMPVLIDPLPAGTYYIVPDIVYGGNQYFTNGDSKPAYVEIVVGE